MVRVLVSSSFIIVEFLNIFDFPFMSVRITFSAIMSPFPDFLLTTSVSSLEFVIVAERIL